jgi:hypothetical protein
MATTRRAFCPVAVSCVNHNVEKMAALAIGEAGIAVAVFFVRRRGAGAISIREQRIHKQS